MFSVIKHSLSSVIIITMHSGKRLSHQLQIPYFYIHLHCFIVDTWNHHAIQRNAIILNSLLISWIPSLRNYFSFIQQLLMPKGFHFQNHNLKKRKKIAQLFNILPILVCEVKQNTKFDLFMKIVVIPAKSGVVTVLLGSRKSQSQRGI